MTFRYRRHLSSIPKVTQKCITKYFLFRRGNTYRQLGVVCLLMVVSLALFTSVPYRTSQHFANLQNTYERKIWQPLIALSLKNSTSTMSSLSKDMTLFSSEDQHPVYLAHSADLESNMSALRLPDMDHNVKVLQGDQDKPMSLQAAMALNNPLSSTKMSLSPDMTLLSSDDPHPGYLVPSANLATNLSTFRSPFIEDSSDVQRTRACSNPDFMKNMPTKTFAVVINCANISLGCFEKFTRSLKKCPCKGCELTTNLETADVVVFFVFRIEYEVLVPKFTRPQHQRWVMWTFEAASRKNNFELLDFPSLKGQFNWTMTYRLDSDIVEFYGRLQPQKLPPKDYFQIFTNKKFPVAWFVSHCTTSSRRDEYVKRMQATVDVHIFGACGTYNCSDGYNRRDSDKDVCLPMLSKSYHFYLAFENSFCQDYVTEKFFKTFTGIDVIPVVRGGTDYKRLFPPNTFIDASDFKTPEDLGRFLLDLSNDGNRYVAMLKEKNKYRYAPANSMFCDLCEKMLTDDTRKWYPDARTWFVKDQCYDPTDLF